MLKFLVLFTVIALGSTRPFADFNLEKDVFKNSSRFDFELSREDMMVFEALVGELKIQLWDNKRIFEVARALANDENLRNTAMQKLAAVVGTDPKKAIYEGFKFAVDKLNETEGMDQDFADVTDEELAEFEDLVDKILFELFKNGKIVEVVRALVGNSQIRNETVGLLKGILYDSNAKEAVRSAFTYLHVKLSEIEETPFILSDSEQQEFDGIFQDLKAELVDKRRIYEAIKALIFDSRIRDGTVQHLKEVFFGEDPKKELLEALRDLQQELNPQQ